MISKRALVALAAGSFVLLSPSPGITAQAGGTTKGKVVATTDDAAIRSVLTTLAEAASRSDAQKMASFFMIDGTYVDEDGQHTKGREEIRKRFLQGLTGMGKAVVQVHPATIKILGRDSAWVEGTSTRTTPIGIEPAARFTMLMQKQDGNWLVASATETPVVNKSASDHLNVLDWMVGRWVAEQGSTKVTMTADWTSSKNFIDCSYVVEQPGAPQKIDHQIIGWDPTRNQIVSWSFSSAGGFGYGSWSRRGKEWVVAAEAVDQAGARTASTNVVTLEDPNKFSWQSTGRIVNGTPVPDTEPVTVQRVVK